VWLGGDDLVSKPKEDEVVVFQSFLKIGLRFPLLNHVFDVIGFFYPDYHNMVQDWRKRKRKVTTKRSKVSKIQAESTPQALEEILVQRVF
jgi:hypothetical protein